MKIILLDATKLDYEISHLLHKLLVKRGLDRMNQKVFAEDL